MAETELTPRDRAFAAMGVRLAFAAIRPVIERSPTLRIEERDIVARLAALLREIDNA